MPVTLIGNIQGPPGNNGSNGAPGADGMPFRFMGTVADQTALDAITGMVAGDVYQRLDNGHAYQYDGTAWVDTGPYRGQQGIQGPTGPEGPAGTGFNMKGTVADQNALDAITGQEIGDAWIREDTGHLYVWDGTDWTDVGDIVGPEGPQGPQGIPGTNGANGAPGVRGTQWWFDSGPPQDPLTDQFPTALSGDIYVDEDTWDMYQWSDGTRRIPSRAAVTPAAPRPPVRRR